MPPKILVPPSTDNFDDDDEFDDAFGDEFVGEEMEASLAKLEESFNQSQRVQPKKQGRSTSSSSLRNGILGSETLKSNAAQSSVIGGRATNGGFDSDDYRVVHKGKIQGGSKLPAGDEDFSDGMQVDDSELEGQSVPTRARTKMDRRESNLDRAGKDSSRVPKRARLGSTEHILRETYRGGDDEMDAKARELEADLERIEELENLLRAKDDEILKFKKENQTRVGEASVLRANLNKTIANFGSMLREKEETIAKQKAINTEMKKMHEEQMARSETINAFKHTELATTAHWSSVTASAARRRGTAGMTSSQQGFSQSQTAAAAAGLTTPTKRNRGATRNLGSGDATSDRSGGAERGSRGDQRGGDESPSSRKSVLKAKQQQNLPSAAKPKPKVPAFPGFVNSFSKKPIQTPSAKKSEKRSGVPTSTSVAADEDEAVFHDDQSSLVVERADQSIGPGPSFVPPVILPEQPAPLDGWSNPEHRHLWAVTTYTKRLSFLSSLILTHKSSPCTTASASLLIASTDSTTLYRLLNASLPSDTPISLQEQYVLATHMLLNSLSSQESVKYAEDRFTYLLDPFEYEEQRDLNEATRMKEEDEAFWACYSLMTEGINEILEELASALCTMLSVSVIIGATERIYDVFVMMRAICIHHPSMLHAILIATHTIQSGEESGESQPQSEEVELLPTQMNGEVNLPPKEKEVDISKLIITCIRSICRLKGDDDESPQTRWKLNVDSEEKLLQAILNIVSLMAYEDQQSNLCTQKLRRILDTPGLLALLLDFNRRSSRIVKNTLSICTRIAQSNSLWRNIIVCKMDKSYEPPKRIGSHVFKTDTPLLEILSQMLVEGRALLNVIDSHAIHSEVITLLTQLSIHHHDALVLIAESNSMLAAIIKCLHLDTGLIWNDEGEEMHSNEDMKLIDIVDRICLNVRFLCQLYIDSKAPTNLTKKLQSHECHWVLNGVKHYFILAISRIAFAPEPEYFDVKASALLGTVSESATELLEMIMSPEEMESAWEMLNDEDEDIGNGDETLVDMELLKSILEEDEREESPKKMQVDHEEDKRKESPEKMQVDHEVIDLT